MRLLSFELINLFGLNVFVERRKKAMRKTEINELKWQIRGKSKNNPINFKYDQVIQFICGTHFISISICIYVFCVIIKFLDQNELVHSKHNFVDFSFVLLLSFIFLFCCCCCSSSKFKISLNYCYELYYFELSLDH